MFTTMKDLIGQTVAFSGYRTDKITSRNPDPAILVKIKSSVISSIYSLHERGFRYFITGGAQGFDLIVASCLMKLRHQLLPDIKIIAAIPHKNQEASYNQNELFTYQRLLDSADQVHYVSKKFYGGVYHDRNKYMLMHSSVLVCYYDGQIGGTMYTVNRALKLGHEIINLCEGYEITNNNKQLPLF